jgi:fumarylacetoacetase
MKHEFENSGTRESWNCKSWIASANEQERGYPLQNLPFCVFQGVVREAHIGVGIGSFVLDLHDCAKSGLFDSLSEEIRIACAAPNLNALMACGVEANSQLRQTLMLLLREGAASASTELLARFLLPMESVVFQMPVAVGNYTDFYASIHHATNVGRLFRPDQPLLPNYKHIPIGYHGRASSLVVSGTSIVRPCGQCKLPSDSLPFFGPCGQLDYELEVGAYIGSGNLLGQPIDIAEAEQHIFGISLVNDWSARDIQAWEYQPLGPFLGKSFATTVSPWVVTMDALRPFRVPLEPRAEGDPTPLQYLISPEVSTAGINIELEVYLSTARMRELALSPVRLSTGNLRQLYWSFAQMVAHHTSNGCNLISGDLIASGTVSGASEGTQGSLLEITRRGAEQLHLNSGEVRSFLEDGDEIVIRGFCQMDGLPRITLGECSGTVFPALNKPALKR